MREEVERGRAEFDSLPVLGWRGLAAERASRRVLSRAIERVLEARS